MKKNLGKKIPRHDQSVQAIRTSSFTLLDRSISPHLKQCAMSHCTKNKELRVKTNLWHLSAKELARGLGVRRWRPRCINVCLYNSLGRTICSAPSSKLQLPAAGLAPVLHSHYRQAASSARRSHSSAPSPIPSSRTSSVCISK